jgi:hypothetical protein
MSDQVKIALIMIIPQLATAFFAYRAAVHSKDASASSKRTEINTNGKMEELLNLTAKSAHAEGKLEGEQAK